MPTYPPLLRFSTYPAHALIVLSGANEGDAMGLGDAALPGDIYRMVRNSSPERLAIGDRADGGACVADGSAVGNPGEELTIVACNTLMGPTGDVVEVLLLTRKTDQGSVLHILPLSTLRPDTEYTLVGCETETAPERFADIASVSFLSGTQLTLADGRQCPVEHLSVGDMLLTRDHGPQPVRWIGVQTRRAVGEAAPVRITEGTLNTARDLRLSPQHRLFIWQRRDEVGAGRAELLVKADLLVNGTTVLREEGGHFDSYQIVFDGHEIIYAEGIAVESLLVTGQTNARLPADLHLAPSGDAAAQAAALEIDEGNAKGDVAERLSRASKGQQRD